MSYKIWIEKTGKTLRLRWHYEGKKKALSLGVLDDPVGRAYAAKKMAEILMDLVSGHYDPTLLKYRPRKLGPNPTEITAVELLGKYTIYYQQERSLTRGSVLKLKGITSKFQRFTGDILAHKVTDSVAKNIVLQWLESASNRTVKEYLYHLKGCWDWAKGKYHIADPNPWNDSLNRSRSKRKNQAPKQPKTFTITEFQAISAKFANHHQYCHYSDFVTFLMNSACRIGEAAGLRWKHLGIDYATAWIGESISRGHQKGTKTGKARTIQLSQSAQMMLLDRYQRINPQQEDLVFPSPKGLPIDDHNFNRRVWRTILASCNIEYRSPYNLRHSAISHALHNGANPIALAEQTGHSKRVLLSTYAHAIEQKCLFVNVGNLQTNKD
jgi:integrase